MSWLSKSMYITYALVPGSYAITVVYDKFGNKISEVKSDLKEEAKNEALDLFEEGKEAGLTVIDDLSDISSVIANAGLDLIRGAGFAVLDATNSTYKLAASIVAPRRVEAIAVGWSMLIYTLTAFTIYNKMKES